MLACRGLVSLPQAKTTAKTDRVSRDSTDGQRPRPPATGPATRAMASPRPPRHVRDQKGGETRAREREKDRGAEAHPPRAGPIQPRRTTVHVSGARSGSCSIIVGRRGRPYNSHASPLLSLALSLSRIHTTLSCSAHRRDRFILCAQPRCSSPSPFSRAHANEAACRGPAARRTLEARRRVSCVQSRRPVALAQPKAQGRQAASSRGRVRQGARARASTPSPDPPSPDPPSPDPPSPTCPRFRRARSRVSNNGHSMPAARKANDSRGPSPPSTTGHQLESPSHGGACFLLACLLCPRLPALPSPASSSSSSSSSSSPASSPPSVRTGAGARHRHRAVRLPLGPAAAPADLDLTLGWA
ncbi:hypothetical protein CDD83_7798 [Cordyceps sp. RAO-2017]|nr:hypothetical protein CDD83_7798 [Cordyceps sp. RAO-2017]